MKKLSKESIVTAYNDIVAERGGKIIGEAVFTRETGISTYYWHGAYWRSWSAFQADAGPPPNQPTQRISDETLLQCFAQLALERSDIPIEADLVLKRQEDPSFPDKSCFRRWGNRNALLAKVADYCTGKGEFARVLQFLKQGASNSLDRRLDSLEIKGFVYLLRSGKYYKIGRSNAVGRRLRELA